MPLGQAVALLETVESGTHRLAAYVVLSLLAGVRTEEARAITWDEVDLKAGTVAVYRSVRVKGDTKTRKSRRVLKPPTRAVQALRAHRTRQAAEQLAAGEMWQEHDLVFCREDGTPLDRWHVRKEFRKITWSARLGGAWTTRGLRHSFVSILSGYHVRLEDITDLVGHSSTSVTETVYRHGIRPALTDNATAVNPPEGERYRAGLPLLRESHCLPNWLPKIKFKNLFDQSGRRGLNARPPDPQPRTARLVRSD